MGFFDSIFKKEKRKTIQLIKVTLDELDSWFEDETKIHFGELNENSKKVLDNIQMLLNQFKENLEYLEEAVIKEEKVDQRLKQIVLSNRNNLVKKMRSFVDSVEIPIRINHKTVSEFYNSFMRKLEDLNKKSIKSYKRTKILFESETSQLLTDLKTMDKLIAELIGPINKKKALIKDIDETKENIENLKKEISLLKKLETDLKSQRNYLDKSKEKAYELKINLEKLVESEEWVYLKKLVTEKEEITKKIDKVRKSLIETLSPLKKSLRKYKNLKKRNKEDLDIYILSPIEALIEKGGIGIFKSIFIDIKESVLSGEIELKDKKKEKTLSLIKKILDTDILKDSIAKHNELNTKLELLDEKISNTKFLEKEVIEKKIKEIEQRIEELEDSIKESNKKSTLLEKDIMEKKTSLENKIESITNQKVNIIALLPKENLF